MTHQQLSARIASKWVTHNASAWHNPELGETLRLTPKEIRNADDDLTIAVRPQPSGGFLVMVVGVTDKTIRGREFVEKRTGIPAAITYLMRDLDKFQGRGDNMSQSSRHRHKGMPAHRASKDVVTKIQQLEKDIRVAKARFKRLAARKTT